MTYHTFRLHITSLHTASLRPSSLRTSSLHTPRPSPLTPHPSLLPPHATLLTPPFPSQVTPPWAAAPLNAYPAGTWQPARRMHPRVGVLYPQLMPPVRITDSALPTQPPTNIGNHTLSFDFGFNIAGVTSVTLDPTAMPPVAMPPSNGGAGQTVIVRMVHAEIEDADGVPDNFYFPGMEKNLPGGPSATCSMPDWYNHSWYECANQSTAFIFEVAASGAFSNHTPALTYTPTFTYHGFRYVRLTARLRHPDGSESPLSGPLAQTFPWGASLTAHRVHSDLRRIGHLTIGGDGGGGGGGGGGGLLDRIFNATIASHVSNLFSIPTDCPQREKRGWMGDAGVSSSSLGTFFDSLSFHSNFLRLIADNQRKGCTDQPTTSIYRPCTTPPPHTAPAAVWFNGSVPDVVPFSTGPYGSNPGTVDWQAAYVMVARSLLLHSGDASQLVLEEVFGSLEALMGYFDRVAGGSPLLLHGARGDWIPPHSQNVSTPTDVVAAFTHTLCVEHMAHIAAALNLTTAAAKYSARLQANRAAFDAHFWNQAPVETHDASDAGIADATDTADAADTAADTDTDTDTDADADATVPPCCYSSGSQAANIFALHIGAVPPARQPATIAALLSSFGDPPHLDVGMFGTTYAFDVLRAYDLDDVGLDILNQSAYPSLGRMVAAGATSLWEAWEGGSHSGGYFSRNHIMFGGGVNRFLAAAVGGMAPLTDGWARIHVKLAPWAVRHVRAASAQRQGSLGMVRVAWRGGEGGGQAAGLQGSPLPPAELELNVTLPRGAAAVIDIPLLSGWSRVGWSQGGWSRGETVTSGCTFSCSPATMGDGCPGYPGLKTLGCRQVPRSEDRILRVEVAALGQHRFVVH